MLGRTIFAATVVAFAQFSAAASSPPACVLGAVNQYSSPIDIKAICQSKDLSSKVADACGDDTKAAMSAVEDICKNAGAEVSANVTATSSGSSYEATGTSGSTLVSVYPTGTASSGSGSPYGGGNSTVPSMTSGPKPTSSSSGIPESTGAAGKIEIGIFAIVAGLLAVAL